MKSQTNFEAFATHSTLVHDIADTDGWEQNGSTCGIFGDSICQQVKKKKKKQQLEINRKKAVHFDSFFHSVAADTACDVCPIWFPFKFRLWASPYDSELGLS